MKKIVGIIAAVAMAASVFAVDFTAGFQLKADLFNYNGTTEDMGALKLWNENSKDDKPFIFTIGEDRAGGTLKFYDSEKGALDSDLGAHAYSIWFKPFDMLKIELGSQDIKLNCEHISWWMGNIVGGKLNNWDGIGDWGYKASVNVDAFTVALAFLPGNDAFWFSKAKDGDALIKETTLYAEYAADFGKINFIFDIKANAVTEQEIDLTALGAGTVKYNEVEKTNLKVGAGYNNTFGDLGFFADVAFFLKKIDAEFEVVGLGKFDFGYDQKSIAIDADVSYNKDAFGAEAYVFWKANTLDAVQKETMDLALFLKASYALNGGTLYAKFYDYDLFADKFASEIHIGYDGNLGCLSYEVEAAIDVAEKVNFSVPCYFRIGF